MKRKDISDAQLVKLVDAATDANLCVRILTRIDDHSVIHLVAQASGGQEFLDIERAIAHCKAAAAAEECAL